MRISVLVLHLLFSLNVVCFHIRILVPRCFSFFFHIGFFCGKYHHLFHLPLLASTWLVSISCFINKLQWVASCVGSLVCVQEYLQDKVPEKGIPGPQSESISISNKYYQIVSLKLYLFFFFSFFLGCYNLVLFKF